MSDSYKFLKAQVDSSEAERAINEAGKTGQLMNAAASSAVEDFRQRAIAAVRALEEDQRCRDSVITLLNTLPAVAKEGA